MQPVPLSPIDYVFTGDALARVADESGWEVLIGPKEATGIGSYLKGDWSSA